MKKSLSLAIVFIMTIGLLLYNADEVLAQETSVKNLEKAEKLQALGFLKGSEKGFELEKELSRIEGSVMLVRLLGKEQIAKEQKNYHTFTDVPEWANDYVGYLYKEGFTNGTSPTTFGSSDKMSSLQFTTLILRAIGYDDKKGDFNWNESIEKAEFVGLLDSEDKKVLKNKKKFSRDDMVGISFNALTTQLKDEEKTLVEKLLEDEVVMEETAKECGLINIETQEDYIDFTYEGIKPQKIEWGMKASEITKLYREEIGKIKELDNDNKEVMYKTEDGKVTFKFDDTGLYQFEVEKIRDNAGDYAIYEEFMEKEEQVRKAYGVTLIGGGSRWGKYSDDEKEKAQQRLKGLGVKSSLAKKNKKYTIISLYGQVNDEVIYNNSIYEKYKNDLSNLKIVIKETVGTGGIPDKYMGLNAGDEDDEYYGFFWLYPDITEDDIKEYKNIVNVEEAIEFYSQEIEESKEKIDMISINRSKLPEDIKDFDKVYSMGCDKEYANSYKHKRFMIYEIMDFKKDLQSYDEKGIVDFEDCGIIVIFKGNKAVGYYIAK